jgi:DNA-binding MarR family transcriptional regulator
VDGSEEKEPPLQAHEHGDDADVENEMGAVRGPTPIAIVNSPIAVPRSANVCAANPTPNDSRALFSLDSEEGRAMHSLAEEWGCDPSERTWIVDRLKKLGLAQRRTVPQDRRLKHVVLTATGQQVRADCCGSSTGRHRSWQSSDARISRFLRRTLEKLAQPAAGTTSEARD